jgi:hypothetical protein
MRKLWKFAFLLLLFPRITYAQSRDETAIRKVFDDYKYAILNDSALMALKTIDAKTKQYYVDILDKVKRADSSTVANISLVDRLTILGLRARATKDEVLAMRGTDAFLFAIKKGMVGKSSVSGNTLGDVTIEQNFAKGELVTHGKKTPLFFHFYKESDGWKFNLTDLFDVSNMALKQILKDTNKSENERLLEILSALTGREIGSEIWEPIKQ